jgi:hypothetical protein
MSIALMITHLEKLLSLHRTMLELTESKRQALVDNQVNEIAGYVNQESRLIKQVSEMDIELRSAVAVYVGERGLKPKAGITVSEIVNLVDNHVERETIKQIQLELLDTIHEIKRSNAINEQLIEQSLAYINYSLDLYTGSFAQDSVYQNPMQSGKPSIGSKSNIRFDTRA